MDDNKNNDIIINDEWFNINSVNELQTIKNNQTIILNEINVLKELLSNILIKLSDSADKNISTITNQTDKNEKPEIISDVFKNSKKLSSINKESQEFFKILPINTCLDETILNEERKKNLLIRSKIPFHFYTLIK